MAIELHTPPPCRPLGDIFDLVDFIIHENTGMTEEKETEFRDCLLRAGRTISEHVRGRF